ncbi:MAG: EAL domain-containing protein [Xanthomonadales bacterium]|nr:EAL domain-containing protein [Xanthomonadales bacterium]
MSPAELIPVLERTHMIVPVGQWIMREALRTARAWRGRQAGMRIAVNVSSRELRHASFIAECKALLKEDLDVSLLDIEITGKPADG